MINKKDGKIITLFITKIAANVGVIIPNELPFQLQKKTKYI